MADKIGASEQNITDWKKSGAVPGWAMLNLLIHYPDAKDFFLKGDPIVADPPEDYGDARRNRLVREVRALAGQADHGVIDALLKNVEQFKRIR